VCDESRQHGSNGGIGETYRKATRPDPTHWDRSAKAPLASHVCRGCIPTEASIPELPVEAPTDDIRVEPYGAETPDDQVDLLT